MWYYHTYLYLISLKDNSTMRSGIRVEVLSTFQEMFRNWKMTWQLSSLLFFWVFLDSFHDFMMFLSRNSLNFKDLLKLLLNMPWIVNFKILKRMVAGVIESMIEFSLQKQKKLLEEDAGSWSQAVLHYFLKFKNSWKLCYVHLFWKDMVKHNQQELFSSVLPMIPLLDMLAVQWYIYNYTGQLWV